MLQNHPSGVVDTLPLLPILKNPPITLTPPIEIRQLPESSEYPKIHGRKQVGVFATAFIPAGTTFYFNGKRKAIDLDIIERFRTTKLDDYAANLNIHDSLDLLGLISYSQNFIDFKESTYSLFTDPTEKCNFTAFINSGMRIGENASNCRHLSAVKNESFYNITITTSDIHPGEELLADYAL